MLNSTIIIKQLKNEPSLHGKLKTGKKGYRKDLNYRIWQDNEAGTGRAFVAERTCKKDPNFINVDIYHSVFLICPFQDKSIINYVSRIDIK